MLWILLAPWAAIYLGASSNQLVLIANHDKFPVMFNAGKIARLESIGPDGLLDDVHCLMTHQTHLNALADIFDLKDGMYSIGDGLLTLGEWLNGFCCYVWIALVIWRLRAYAN